MIAGLASVLPRTLTDGLASHGVPADVANQVGSLPPVGSLFAAFLGYNPIEHLVGSMRAGRVEQQRERGIVVDGR